MRRNFMNNKKTIIVAGIILLVTITSVIAQPVSQANKKETIENKITTLQEKIDVITDKLYTIQEKQQQILNEIDICRTRASR